MKNAILIFWLTICALPAVSQDREKPLHLFAKQIQASEYKNMSLDFKNSFTYLANPAFDDFVFEKTSYSEIAGLLQQLPAAPQDTFIRMLRIFYGFDTTINKIRLIYFPDYAVRKSLTIYEYMKGEIPPGNTTVNLCGADGTFAAFDYNSPEITRLIFGYRQSGKLKFRDMVSGNLSPLDFSDLERSSARQEDFPFQEIEGFFKDSAMVLFTSIARPIIMQGPDPIKHSIAITGCFPQNITDNVNVAADLGSLCPIRCKDLELKFFFGFNAGRGIIVPGGWGPKTKFRQNERFILQFGKERKQKVDISIIERNNKFLMQSGH